MRTITELLSDDSAWPMIQEWIKVSTNPVTVLENTKVDGEAALLQLQVTTRSGLGAVALECGGLIVDHGWLHVLGSGHPDIYGSLIQNQSSSLLKEGFVVAYDVAGGIFALNNGQFDPESRHVFYFAPDTLEWEDTERGYTDFLDWVFHGDLQQYYETFRWNGWEKDVEKLSSGHGISYFPYLWTEQGKDVEGSHRAAIPLEEIWGIQNESR